MAVEKPFESQIKRMSNYGCTGPVCPGQRKETSYWQTWCHARREMMGHFLIPHITNCCLQTVKQRRKNTYENSRNKSTELDSRKGLAEMCSEWMLWKRRGKSINLFLHWSPRPSLDKFYWWAEDLEIHLQHHWRNLESVICSKRKNKVKCCVKSLTCIRAMWISP